MSFENHQPPRWADRMLEWLCAPHLQEEIRGDMLELYGKWTRQHGPQKARLFYIYHAFGFLRPFALRKKEKHTPNQLAMFNNYITTLWRHLWRQKQLSFINVLGLSLGLACCMLTFLYTKDELSYDRFHDKKDRLHQLTYTFMDLDKQEKNAITYTGIVAGETFLSDIPDVEAIVRIKGNGSLVRKGADVIRENLQFADANFFTVFTFPLLEGNAKTALHHANSIVLTEAMALKYFGTSHVIGNELQVNWRGEDFETFTITAVARNSPENSSIRFDFLVPFDLYKKTHPVKTEDWFAGYLNTFILLHPQAKPQAVEEKFGSVMKKYAGELLEQLSKEYHIRAKITYGLQPVTDIHLSAAFGGNNVSKPMYSYIMITLSFFILLIACFNFVNLSVAQAMARAKEIGIRKISGGHRNQLIVQFLTESFLISLLAFVMAFAIAMVALPVFNELANKKLSLSYLADSYLVAVYGGLLIITSLLAGGFPAGILSGFSPVQSLYGRLKLTGRNAFAKSLVIVQFAMAIFLTVGTLVISWQSRYMLNHDLGYDDKNLIRVALTKGNRQASALKNELEQSASVVSVAASSGGFNRTLIRTEGKDMAASDLKVDEHYIPSLGIPLIKGRNFTTGSGGDSSLSVIINEAFIKEAGWEGEPLGRIITMPEQSDQPCVVIGVVKDYNNRSLREKIQPMVLHQMPDYKYRELLVRVQPTGLDETMAFLHKSFKRTESLHPPDMEFVDVRNALQYHDEMRWKQIMIITTGMAILISCIGLFGLAALSIQQRTKEIGIRKVLGASSRAIVSMLSMDFIRLVILALVIAFPAGYYACERWLETFAYRIELSWWIFAASGILCCAVAIFTISFQSLRAAMINPGESLRNE
jgi:putative ABC transport system permease protein